MSGINKLLIVSEEDRKKIRKAYNKTEEEIKFDLNLLRDWLKKQPQDIDDVRLENFLIKNKYRVERTKTKLDGYFTLKGVYPRYFQPERLLVDSQGMLNMFKCCYITMLPNLQEDGTRIIYCKLIDSNSDLMNLTDIFAYTMFLFDLMLSFDYSASIRFVADIAGMTFGHYTKMDPAAITACFLIYQEAFSARIAGIHYINGPGFADLLLKLMKMCLKPKIFQKIGFYDSFESLSEVVPKKDLPTDVGGDQGLLKDLQADWIEEMRFRSDWIREMSQKISNEKLRIGPSPYNNLFGVEGTFKKLNID